MEESPEQLVAVTAAKDLAPVPEAGVRPAPSPSTGPTATGPGRAGSTTSAGVASARSYVYAIGRIEPRFPSLALEKEFAQTVGRAGTAGLTDRQVGQSALAERANR